ncbi:MAG: adenosylcobinamide-GDP ribazoletransferase [Cyanobacteria bacterium P01_H01_bin.121]
MQTLQSMGNQLLASLTFYTALPFPYSPKLDFTRIARFAPVVGVVLATILIACDLCCEALTVPLLTRAALLVAVWIYCTGGLHLDGAMDTADGLAVTDPRRRLAVMADSHTGAFGAIAAVVIVLLKVAALRDLTTLRIPGLMFALVWGRWAQVAAIARYPYLKPDGKGAFHKQHFQAPWDWLLGLGVIAVCSVGFTIGLPWLTARQLLAVLSGGLAIALGTGAWLNQQLGGHTGDTYGAVVEWTEALFLCWLTLL